MSGKYDSLLRRGRLFSGKHPPMPNCERAAQFAPFAALEGHAAAVSSTAQLVRLQVEEREKQQAGWEDC